MRKVVSQFGQGPLQQKLTAGDLHFLSDAEVSKGGSGTGPSPHEYLGAALAACTFWSSLVTCFFTAPGRPMLKPA